MAEKDLIEDEYDEVEDPQEPSFEELEDGFRSDEETDEESESRRAKHAILKKNDKIFNNSYNTGDGIQRDDYHSQEIRLSPAHSDSYLQESDGYTDRLNLSVVQDELAVIYKKNPKILEIVGPGSEKKKFTKTDVNYVFSILIKELNASIFANSIHVLDAVCNLLQLEYKKAFDMLDYEHKELLIGDLDSHFGVLNSNFKARKSSKTEEVIDEDDSEDYDDPEAIGYLDDEY